METEERAAGVLASNQRHIVRRMQRYNDSEEKDQKHKILWRL